MPKTEVLDMTGKKVGEIELSEAVFGVEPNKALLHEAVKSHLANRRQGTQSTLTRAEVRGGGRKPWRQKGTGRARQGSIRSPQWHHGGIALGPKPRTYKAAMNKKARRAALKSALSLKVSEGKLVVIDELVMNEIKTKTFAAFLGAVKATGKALVATAEKNEKVYLSARNIEGVSPVAANLINTYDLLNADVFVLDKAAVAKIEEVFA